MSDLRTIKILGDLFASSGSGKVKNAKCSHKKPTRSCIPEVIKKLRKHPDYQEPCLENHLKTEAEDLTDAEKIMNRYFSSITYDLVAERIREQEMERDCELVSTYETRAKNARAKHRVEDVARFQVKLLLRYVDSQTSPPKFIGKVARTLQMEYGPLHASLLINNEILIEWNTSSLVIPKFVDPSSATGPVLVAASVAGISTLQRHLSRPFEAYDEVELLLDAATQKIELLQKLAEMIAKYNSHYYYDVIFRNCQNFVLDTLTAIGCKNKPNFSGNLRDYFTHLKKEGRVKAAFKTHQELDMYVQENHRELPQENMEYLLAQYYLLHMQSLMKGRGFEDWSCEETGCMMEFLEAKVDQKSLMMHQFLRSVGTSIN